MRYWRPQWGNQAQSLEGIVRGSLPGGGVGPIMPACWDERRANSACQPRPHICENCFEINFFALASVGSVGGFQVTSSESCISGNWPELKAIPGKKQSGDHWREIS